MRFHANFTRRTFPLRGAAKRGGVETPQLPVTPLHALSQICTSQKTTNTPLLHHIDLYSFSSRKTNDWNICRGGPLEQSKSFLLKKSNPKFPFFSSTFFRRHQHNETSFSTPPRVWRVALIGRANVGKSSLYNRLITSRKSEKDIFQQLAIVGHEPGTTRDRKDSPCFSWGGLNLILSDNVGFDDTQFHLDDENEVNKQIDEQLNWTIRSCDLILFVVDAAEGITPVDEFLARRLVSLLETKNKNEFLLKTKNTQEKEKDSSVSEEHQSSSSSSLLLFPRVILVLNKAEGTAAASCLADAYELQLGHPELVSAKTTQGLEELYERVKGVLKERQKCLTTNIQENEIHENEDFSRERKPQNISPTEAWLEGLARRYGRGVRPSLSHMQITDDVLLPWSLEKRQIDDSQQKERQMNDEDEVKTTKEEEEEDEPCVDNYESEEDIDIAFDEESENDERVKKKEKSKREEVHEASIIRVTFIGRPNAGKSSLINSILKDERLSVSEVPGTTRDSVRLEFTFKKQQFMLTDTAGVYRGWRMRGDDLLQHACMQTLRNICQADVCVLCLDASRIEEKGHISSNDLSLANLASEKEGRCLVVCVTKWDLIEPINQAPKLRSLILERMQTGLGHLKSCPVVFTSATHAHNLDVLLNKIRLIYKQWNSRVPTPQLNAWLAAYTARWPPPWRLGSQCQVKYITQARTSPPTFVAWSNVYAHFPTHYKRQLVNAIREEFNMKGVPVRLVLRTTAMPKPGAKLTKDEVLKWKRLGPHQHKAATKLARKFIVKKK